MIFTSKQFILIYLVGFLFACNLSNAESYPSNFSKVTEFETGNIRKAYYANLTDRYPHGALGDKYEYADLILELASGKELRFVLPYERVFEDTHPRLFDIDKDGSAEVITVESHQNKGARLAIYNEKGLLTTTPYIGQSFRWLAPLGAADLTGDGNIEIAYVDRPHLVKTIRIWSYQKEALTPIADLTGFSNHAFGETQISGGIRNCDGKSSLISANSNYSKIMEVYYDTDKFESRELFDFSRENYEKALGCSS